MSNFKPDTIINLVNAIIDLVEEVDPNAANNPILEELKKAISVIKTLGI